MLCECRHTHETFLMAISEFEEFQMPAQLRTVYLTSRIEARAAGHVAAENILYLLLLRGGRAK